MRKHQDDWETTELCVDHQLSEILSLDVGSIGRSREHWESVQATLQHQPNHLQQQCHFREMSMSLRTTLPPIVRPDVTTLSYNPQQYTKGSHRHAVCICQRSVGEMELDL